MNLAKNTNLERSIIVKVKKTALEIGEEVHARYEKKFQKKKGMKTWKLFFYGGWFVLAACWLIGFATNNARLEDDGLLFGLTIFGFVGSVVGLCIEDSIKNKRKG
jgi:hypothetical protein